jgi:hypothetical protein
MSATVQQLTRISAQVVRRNPGGLDRVRERGRVGADLGAWAVMRPFGLPSVAVASL